MNKTIRIALFFTLLTAGVPAFASTATEFYLELLQRGTTEVEAGRYDTSITPLRLAAFGLVDSIEHYERAQAYLAVASDKLGKQDDAKKAALRIVAAEGIERKFADVDLPAPVRAALVALARRLLSPSEAAMLIEPSRGPVVPRQSTTPIVPPAQTPAATRAQTAPAQQPSKTVPAPSTPAPRNAPPKVAEAPKPVPQKEPPARVAPPAVETAPPASSSSSNKPAETPRRPEPAKAAPVTPPKSPVAAPKPETAQSVSKPEIRTIPPQPERIDLPSRLAAGEKALSTSNLPEARRVYRELLTVASLDRGTIIRIGEGLYRARDFAAALTAFRRLGALKPGEEAYRYYIAVALFETGDFPAAKRELATALPFIEATPDVQRYRQKIEGAVN